MTLAALAGPFLLTGDSMMWDLQGRLAPALRDAGVADVRQAGLLGSGITKLELFDWVRLAERQAREEAPAVTVVFVGAGDLYPLHGVRCCGPRWVDAYAARAARMTRSWQRDGAGRVYWVTLPRPVWPKLVRPFRAVNRAIARTTRRTGAGLVDVRPLITPGGRYRRTVVVDGRRLLLRHSDGIHLRGEGLRRATDAVVARLRADGALPPATANVRQHSL